MNTETLEAKITIDDVIKFMKSDDCRRRDVWEIAHVIDDEVITELAQGEIDSAAEDAYEEGRMIGISKGENDKSSEVQSQAFNCAVSIFQGDQKEALHYLSMIADSPSLEADARGAASRWGSPVNNLKFLPEKK